MLSRRTLGGLLACLLIFTLAPIRANELEPFHAEFKLKFAIFSGDVSLDLRPDEEPGHYTYEVITEARGLAKTVLRETAVETTSFALEGEEIIPEEYHLDDGRGKTENQTDIEFDWKAGKAYSRYEGEDLTTSIEPGVLDRLSADIVVIMALREGKSPGDYPVFDGEDIETYEFIRLGEESVSVPAGEFDAVKYRRQRPGSRRSTLIWYAPDQDYLPVKIEQQKDNKTSVTMVATLLQPGTVN